MAAEAVARRYRLHSAWLNTVRPGALQPPSIVPERHLWKLYQVLYVYLPNPEFVLVQKLLIHRPKDQPDIQALFSKLKVSSRAEAQALVDRYVPVDEQQRHNYEHIPILLMSADMPQEVSGNKHLRTLQKPFELETLLLLVAELLA